MSIASDLPATAYLAGPLGSAVAYSQTVKQSLDTLSQQASTGYISTSFSGLGAGMSSALALPPAINDLTTWQNNINAASGPMQVQQTALSQISSIASSFYAQIATLNGVNGGSIGVFAANAQSALAQVAGLLDSTDGANYVFAGQDSGNPPVPNPNAINSSGFATQIATAVGGLGTAGAATTISSILGIASSNTSGTSPFSASMSQPAGAVNALQPSIQTGTGSSAVTGIMASANAFAPSTASGSTGSYIRDIMSSLAVFGSINAGTESASGFQALISNVGTVLNGAVSALNDDAGALGTVQSSLTTQGTALSQVQTALQGQVANAEDVDTAATLTKLSQTQTQLQASYEIISALEGLSLTKYLTTTA